MIYLCSFDYSQTESAMAYVKQTLGAIKKGNSSDYFKKRELRTQGYPKKQNIGDSQRHRSHLNNYKVFKSRAAKEVSHRRSSDWIGCAGPVVLVTG